MDSASPSSYDVDYAYDPNGNLLTLQRRNESGAMMNDFTYGYYAGTNRLREVIPVSRDTVYNSGPITKSNNKVYRNITLNGSAYVPAGANITLQASENIFAAEDFRVDEDADFFAHVLGDNEGTYQYDAIGNLIANLDEGAKIKWTVYGKVREVSTRSDSVIVSFRYDATGNRIEKRITKWDTTYVTQYVRDASGNVMATYRDALVTEMPIYGSSRSGMYTGRVKAGARTLGNRSTLGIVGSDIRDQPSDKVTGIDVINYSKYKNMTGSEQSDFFAGLELKDFNVSLKFEAIQSLERIAGGIKEGGTLILGGCAAGACLEKLNNGDIQSAFYNLFGGRINLLINQGVTMNTNPGFNQYEFLDAPRSTSNSATG